jgi:hypothetical protein
MVFETGLVAVTEDEVRTRALRNQPKEKLDPFVSGGELPGTAEGRDRSVPVLEVEAGTVGSFDASLEILRLQPQDAAELRIRDSRARVREADHPRPSLSPSELNDQVRIDPPT